MEQYNILIVEDDKEIRDGIEIFLKSQNYNVFKAADGVEGLEVMEREKISGDEFKIIMEGGELPPFDPEAEARKKAPLRREDEEGTLTADPLEEENLNGEGMEESAGQPSQAEPEETAGEAAPQAPESAQAGPQEAPAPEKAPKEEPRQAGEDEPRA